MVTLKVLWHVVDKQVLFLESPLGGSGDLSTSSALHPLYTGVMAHSLSTSPLATFNLLEGPAH